jgi:hypothetical protein
MKTTTIRVEAKLYEDCDDCLIAAADDVAEERGLVGYDLNPRWEDNERDVILIDVPTETETDYKTRIRNRLASY